MSEIREQTVQEPYRFKNCARCGVRCRTVDKSNPMANYFVKGDARSGKFCANCLIVDFFKNFDLGPSSALGKEFFDSSLPQPKYRKELGDEDPRFDPESLRLPHIQAQLTNIILVAHRERGAELDPAEIDWDEVIANWHLPFPDKKGRRK